MTEYTVIFHILRQAESQLSVAQMDAMNVKGAYNSIVECHREFSEMRRSFLFRGNRSKDVFDLALMIEKLHMAGVDYAQNKIKYQISISKVISYLVEIIKMVAVRDEGTATQKDEKFLYPKYRNDVRAVIRLVNETKGLGIDFSSDALCIASAYVYLSSCEQSKNLALTVRLLKSLLDSF